MRAETLSSLARCVELLSTARQDWWLIGGAAFLAHGVGSGVLKDVDVLVGTADAETLAKSSDVTLLERGASTRFSSAHYFSCCAGQVPIEFMAGLRVRKEGDWHPVLPQTRVRRQIGEIEVYVPEAGELVKIARLFGRRKDLERARLLISSSKYAPAAKSS